MPKNTKITIYSSSLCGYCYRAKSLLIRKNIEFQEIDIDEDFTKKNEMVLKSKGSTTVPQIFIEEHHMGGCDDLFYLEELGKLDGLNEK
jgi:glutaredoxin 3